MFKIVIFILFAILAKCNAENKDEKDVKNFKMTLQNVSSHTEISIVGRIVDFKGFLMYYIDRISRQIIALLNLDKSMTIKFGCNDYKVNPHKNSCVPGSLNNYTFVINRTHILYKCNGNTDAVVKACGKINEDYPFPSFSNYSVLIYLFNNDKLENYNNKPIYPSPDQPNVTLEIFSVNGVPMINSSKINSSAFDMEKNKTFKGETVINQANVRILYSIPFLIVIIGFIVLIAIIVSIVISIQHRRRSNSSEIANPTIGNDSSRGGNLVEDFLETEFISQNAQVPSDIIIQMEDHLSETVQSGITLNRSTDETQALIETGCLEENYSSQSFAIIFEKEREF